MKYRLSYPDICKCIAMFIVTCGHCAQAISGLNWTSFLGGGNYAIAFHMPLFIIVSGFFINLDKIRSISFLSQLKQKTLRLFVPAICWFFIYRILLFRIPEPKGIITCYWFLTALYFCHLIIILSAKITDKDFYCWIISLVISVLISIPLLERVGFMMPFLVIGHYLFRYIEKQKSIALFVISIILSILLLCFWSVDRTVYKSPLVINNIDSIAIGNYFYRIVTGSSISICIILAVKYLSKYFSFSKMQQYGSITLVIYTFSFIFNGVVRKIFHFLQINTNEYLFLNVLSIMLCMIIFISSKYLIKQLRKNRYTKVLFCGE